MAKSKFDSKKWEPMGATVENIWDYRELKAGAEFEGVYKRTKTGLGENNSSLHIFDDNKGVEWGVWGCALLDTRFSSCVEGQVVGIQYLGKEVSEKTGRPYHNFEVFKQKLEDEEINLDDVDL